MSEPLRIAIDATPLLGPRTGIGVSTEAIINRLAVNPDFHVSGFIVSLRGRKDLSAALPSGVTELALPFSARIARTLWKQVAWPRLGEFDVVHGTNFVVPPSKSGVGLVTINDLTPWTYPELATSDTRRYPQLVERARQRGCHVHAISHFVANEVVEKLDFEPERVHAIPLGFEPGPPGDPARGQSLAGGDNYLIAIGTIEPRKDYPGLLRTLATLRKSRHPDLRLVVIGADGWGVDAFVSELEHLGLDDAVKRTGFVSEQDKADMLAGARCLVYPSLYEGFGLPPLEAMAAGVPVVTTAAGAIPEVVGDAALVVEVGDVEAMAQAIDRLIEDSELGADLAQLGRNRVALFDWDQTVAQLVELYRAIAGY